jgi:hypothetical protein
MWRHQITKIVFITILLILLRIINHVLLTSDKNEINNTAGQEVPHKVYFYYTSYQESQAVQKINF